MGFLKRTIGVLLIHFIFFVCFPDTGRTGIGYAWVSIAVWTGFMFVASNMLNTIRSLLFTLLFDIALVGFMGFGISATMPQSDGVSPYKKILRGHYPTQKQIRRGFRKFGIKVPKFQKPVLTSEK